MNSPVTYWLKTYSVKAVRLTNENIRGIAESIVSCSYDETHLPNITITGSMGFAGDWVVQYGENLYGVYTHEAFMRKFHTHDEEMSQNSRYAKIFQHVATAMAKQDKATHQGDQTGMDMIMIQTVKKIIGEL
jgi:hypothetical protein